MSLGFVLAEPLFVPSLKEEVSRGRCQNGILPHVNREGKN